MRRLFISVLLYASVGFTTAQTNVRQVDFKNFIFPIRGTLLAHDRLQWLDVRANPRSNGKSIHVVNGKSLRKSSSIVMDDTNIHSGKVIHCSL